MRNIPKRVRVSVVFREVNVSLKINVWGNSGRPDVSTEENSQCPGSKINSRQSRNYGNMLYRNGQYSMILRKHRKNYDSNSHFPGYFRCPGCYANCLMSISHIILITTMKKK